MVSDSLINPSNISRSTLYRYIEDLSMKDILNGWKMITKGKLIAD